jgi:hypothetical protein
MVQQTHVFVLLPEASATSLIGAKKKYKRMAKAALPLTNLAGTTVISYR